MSSGLGFNKYAARYMSKVVEAGGTTPGLLVQQSLEDLATKCHYHLSLNNRRVIGVWPFYGGTADSHAINLFGEELVTWQGTVTHNSTGITGDGLTGFGSSGIAPSTQLQSFTKLAYGVYSRTNSNTDRSEMGCGGGAYLRLSCRNAAGNVVATYAPAVNVSAVNASSAGLTHFAKYTATSNNLYRNGAGIGATATTWSNVPPGAILISADGIITASNRNLAFAFFADTVTDNPGFYTSVQSFQTSLARQV